jgi:AraC-like DNA-binding protein
MKSRKIVLKSDSQTEIPHEPLDRLSDLLDRFRVQATLFHEGPLCGRTVFEAQPNRAFVHVLRRGDLVIEHPRSTGLKTRVTVHEPSLILYPRSVSHTFVNPPCEGADFTCAELRFDGGDWHPIVAALPPLLVIPIHVLSGLCPALDLLFAEAAQRRCGSRLLADRLFEVVLIQLFRWLMDHPDQVGLTHGLFRGMAHPRLARALVALHREPHEMWTLQRLATEAHMSRSTFAHVFRTIMACTPMAYLTEWRLILAASMLRQGQPQKSVAAELGFATASSLSRAFKLRYGSSPRAWVADVQHGQRRRQAL